MQITLRKPLRPLMPKQAEGVAYLSRMYRTGRGGLLFKEMRLGKTATYIRFTKQEKLPGPFLIVCPNSVKASWVNELLLEHETNFVVLDGSKQDKIKTLYGNLKWVIINYEAAVPSLGKKKFEKYGRTGIELELYQWLSVVLDESTKIADGKSSTTKYFLKQFPHVKFKYCLCGQPAPEGPLQFVNQFIFVLGNFMGFKDQWHFLQANYIEINHQLIPRIGAKKLMYLFVHQWAFVCTRKEAGIGSKKIRQIRTVAMNPALKKAYAQVQKEMRYKELYTKFKLTQCLFLHKLSSGFDISTEGNGNEWLCENKIKELKYLLSTELKNEQVMIWCKFRHEVSAIVEALTEYKVRYIHGDVPPEVREKNRVDFHAGKYQVNVATIEALAKGTDWSCADTSIYFSLDYSWDDVSQSEDRIIHPKKKTPVLLIYLLTAGSIDRHIYNLLICRKKVESDFFMSLLYLRMLEKIDG